MKPAVSIVMTTYNRAPLLERTLASIFCQEFKDYEVIIVDDGNDKDTPELCDHYIHPVRYFKRVREPGTFYSNPSVPNNIGIRKALGDLVILQNAECVHASPEVIKSFLDQTKSGTCLFGKVEALKPDGNHEQWYTHPVQNRRPFFFCGALHRKVFEDLRGFDENFKFYGLDDNQMADRLERVGIEFVYSNNIHIHHQWHPVSFKEEDMVKNIRNQIYYENWKKKFNSGEVGVEVNLDQDWGVL